MQKINFRLFDDLVSSALVAFQSFGSGKKTIKQKMTLQRLFKKL